LAALVVLALEVAGCNVRPAEWPELRFEDNAARLQVVPMRNEEVAELTTDDIVKVMRRLGLSDEQILEMGGDLFTALRSSGAAKLVAGKSPEATLAVNSGYLFIRSRLQGSFIYDIDDGRFGLLPSLSPESP